MIAGIGKINSTPSATQNQNESSVLALQASQELPLLKQQRQSFWQWP
jgi:hypothetical protein